jgi:hypothetical protein
MELVKPIEGRIQTIFPLPDTDPDFSIEVRTLSDAEQARIYDRHGYFPGCKRQMEKLSKVLADIAEATIVRVNNGTHKGIPLDPTSSETKKLITSVPVEIGDEKKSLWDYTMELAREQREAEEKNSLRV